MSKIQAELVDITGIKATGDRPDFLKQIVLALSDLSDKDYDTLSDAAQEWSNGATAALNNKKAIPDFPDYEPPAAAPARSSSGRRRAKAEETERITKVGDTATIVTKRGQTYTGEVIEVSDDMTVLLVGDTEMEFPQDRIESCTVKSAEAQEQDDGPETPELGVGDMATLTNKRGKTITGTIVEMSDDLIVIDDGKGEQEFARDRVESLVPAAKEEPEPPKSTRTRAAAAPAPAASTRTRTAATVDRAAPAAKDTAEGKPSVSQRIKEIIVDDMGCSVADICKVLKKEGLEFREATVKINHADLNRFLEVLRARKLLK